MPIIAAQPTLPGGTPLSWALPNDYATPLPAETVGLGEVVEVAPAPPALWRYQLQSEKQPDGKTQLYATDTQTGQKTPLGDATGTALPVATAYTRLLTDRYLPWLFVCEPCTTLQRGLYLYAPETATSLLVDAAFSPYADTVQVTGEWVTYLVPNDRYHATLKLYHLATAQYFTLSHQALYTPQRQFFSAINEGQLAWLDVDETTPEKVGTVLRIYDVTTQLSKTVNLDLDQLAAYASVQALAVSNRLVVLHKGAWWGYDLTRQVLFTIPVVPPGIEPSAIEGVNNVWAHGDQISWTLTIAGQVRQFNATVVDKTPAPLP